MREQPFVVNRNSCAHLVWLLRTSQLPTRADFWARMHHKGEQPVEELERIGGRGRTRRLRREKTEHARQRATQHGRVLSMRVCNADQRRSNLRNLGEQHSPRHLIWRERALEQSEHARVHGRFGLPAVLCLQ